MSDSFNSILYEEGLSHARNGQSPSGFDLNHKDASYIAGVINGTEYGKRTVADGLRWDASELGSCLADIAGTLDLPYPVRALTFAAAQVLEPAQARRAVDVARKQLQDDTDEEE